ncbi:MAG: hypothetical protein ACRC33_01225 [Gemmataceae bacterium]
MQTATLVYPHEIPERDIAAALEARFGAVWFEEYHRCSIDTDSAVVYVDIDGRCAGWAGVLERQRAAAELGFVPVTALHVQASPLHSGSLRLAADVVTALRTAFGGRALSAA